MPCHGIRLESGQTAIVCTGRRKRQKCVKCGRPADLLCDWRVPLSVRKTGTCDKPICGRCTVSPAKDKDLCPDHAAEWANWKAARS